MAQSGILVAVDTVKKVKIIEAVPIANIGAETEVTLRRIRELKSRIQPAKEEIEIEVQMPDKLEFVANIKKDLDMEEVGKMDIRQMESLKSDFSQMRVQLESWRNSLMKISKVISQDNVELNEIKLKWDKTQNQDHQQALPSIVTERIQTNLDEINAFEKHLSERNNALLTKQDSLTGTLIFVNDVLATLNRMERSQRANIFKLISPPIWKVRDTEQNNVSALEMAKNVYNKYSVSLKNFSSNYKENIYFHLLFFLVLLFLSIHLKREVARWPDEKKDGAVKFSLQVISKPFPASLLVSLLLSGLFYPDAPSDILNYYYILLVVPIITIIPGLIPSVRKEFFYGMAGVFVLTQVLEYFSGFVFISRLILICLNIATIILMWYLHKDRHNIQQRSPKMPWGLVFQIIYINMVLLAVAVIANCIGSTILSRILTQGALTMIYGGVLIFAGAIVLHGIVALILEVDRVSRLNVIKNYADLVRHRFYQIINWVLVYYWLYLSLSGFLMWDPIYEWVGAVMTRQWHLGSLAISLGSIFMFFITIWISIIVSRFIRFILQEEILTHFELQRGVSGAISMMVRLSLIAIGFILALAAANIPLDKVTLIFGALGVGIGFGLQNIFNNLVSGLILAFERPIQIGDVIQISTLNLMGEVKEIGIRASIVRTFDGAEVVVPNGNLISNEMINWTLSDQRRRQEIIVGVAYGTDIPHVLEILNRIVAEQEFVLKVPSSSVLFMGFSESSLEFKVLFWTQFDHGMSTRSAVGIAINEAFKKEGIEIPFPQRDLHIRSGLENVNLPKQKESLIPDEAAKKTASKPKTTIPTKPSLPAKNKPESL